MSWPIATFSSVVAVCVTAMALRVVTTLERTRPDRDHRAARILARQIIEGLDAIAFRDAVSTSKLYDQDNEPERAENADRHFLSGSESGSDSHDDPDTHDHDDRGATPVER